MPATESARRDAIAWLGGLRASGSTEMRAGILEAQRQVVKVNKLVDDVKAGHGTLGKLTEDEELANKLQNTINKLSAIVDRLEAGQGSAGQFLKNPSFYNNTDQLLIESRNLVKAIRENPKKYLTIHLRLF